jgi:hypothetical protein
MVIRKVHEQDQSRQPFRAGWIYVRQHRKIAAATLVVAAAIATVLPYAFAASHDQTPVNMTQAASGNQPSQRITTNGDQKGSTTPMPETNSSHSSNQTNVTVNGQAVDVPANGNYHQVTQDGNNRTEVNVQSSQSSTGNSSSSSNNSSVNINVNSQSSSSSSD